MWKLMFTIVIMDIKIMDCNYSSYKLILEFNEFVILIIFFIKFYKFTTR